MAEKLVTVKTVQQAVAKLQSQGERPSNRRIRHILGGGSPNEIQAILRQIEEAEGAGVSLPIELPGSLQSSLLTSINSMITAATAGLMKRVEDAIAGQTDALDELEQAQEQLEKLRAQLDHSLDQLKFEQQRTKGLDKQIDELKIERQQLIEAGEVARTAAAKAQLQVDRADQSTAKCEARIVELEQKLDTERELRHAAEIRAAAAEARILPR